MTREELMAIAKRHVEDMKPDKPRPTPAMLDRGELLKFVVECASREFGEPLQQALKALRPPLKRPRLPKDLKTPKLPAMRTRGG